LPETIHHVYEYMQLDNFSEHEIGFIFYLCKTVYHGFPNNSQNDLVYAPMAPKKRNVLTLTLPLTLVSLSASPKVLGCGIETLLCKSYFRWTGRASVLYTRIINSVNSLDQNLVYYRTGGLIQYSEYKKVKASHTRYRALGPELIPVYRQSARMWLKLSHPPGGRLLLLSARPAVTFPAAEHYSPLAGTHFTVSRRVKGWVDLGG